LNSHRVGEAEGDSVEDRADENAARPANWELPVVHHLRFTFTCNGDQIRSDQIRSDQIRSDQIRSDQIRSDQIETVQKKETHAGGGRTVCEPPFHECVRSTD
jgi:hypothetical protein